MKIKLIGIQKIVIKHISVLSTKKTGEKIIEAKFGGKALRNIMS
jgi:hypothetical protein